MKDIGAIVFLAESFGDLILPEAEQGTCSRTKPLEKGRDYLAAPIFMLEGDQRYRRRNNDHSKGCLQVTDHFFWHGFDPNAILIPCACADGNQCRTISRLGRRAREHVNNSSRNLGPVDVFEAFRDGAAIIGGPNLLYSATSTITPRTSPLNPPEEDSGGQVQIATTRRRFERLKGRVVAILRRRI